MSNKDQNKVDYPKCQKMLKCTVQHIWVLIGYRVERDINGDFGDWK